MGKIQCLSMNGEVVRHMLVISCPLFSSPCRRGPGHATRKYHQSTKQSMISTVFVTVTGSSPMMTGPVRIRLLIMMTVDEKTNSISLSSAYKKLKTTLQDTVHVSKVNASCMDIMHIGIKHIEGNGIVYAHSI